MAKTKPYESFQLQWSCNPGTTLQIRGSVLDTSPPRKQRKGRTPGRKLRALCARGDASTVACSSLSRTSTRVGRIRPRLGFGRGIAATLETLPGSRQAADRGVTLRCPRVPGLAGLGTRGRPVGSGDPVPRNSLQGGRDCGRSWGPARGATVLFYLRRLSIFERKLCLSTVESVSEDPERREAAYWGFFLIIRPPQPRGLRICNLKAWVPEVGHCQLCDLGQPQC
ncbi:uncharacterized protein LOC117016618 [Rhinolophus ferrumequinum]|uniref:uncharacterized protein LOC117016618 n=1 Tax=Rhinolophus ferrumequinum TaxID=59479 RepID=UPI00140FCF56|nr:uncharacterized protein LOC117016618 [Rhinolophus ferrumequinum]